MKRILVLSYEYPPLGGGTANAVYHLCREFSDDPDLRIDLVAASIGASHVARLSENVTLHLLDIRKSGSAHYQSIRDLLVYSHLAYRYCKALKKRTKFDLVHAWSGIPCGYIAMKLGAPYIVSLRGSDVPFFSKRFFWLDILCFRRLSRKIWSNARAVVANSRGLKELALRTSSAQQIGVIHNGVDTEEFSPAEKRGVHEGFRLISVGRLVSRKGYHYLIEALAGLPNIQLILIGDGNMKTGLEQMARDLNIDAHFLGKLNKKAIVVELHKADVFILPSLNEGMSNAILEAMACGLPVIATETGGSQELIKQNGYIVEKESPRAIRQAVLRLCDDPGQIVSLGLASRRLAEGMSWRRVARQYKELYGQLA